MMSVAFVSALALPVSLFALVMQSSPKAPEVAVNSPRFVPKPMAMSVEQEHVLTHFRQHFQTAEGVGSSGQMRI